MIATLQMAVTALLAASVLALEEVPPVPGGCSTAAAENQDKPGCYLSAELQLASAPPRLYWHIHEADDSASATAEARRHPWSRVIHSHARNWLYVLNESGEKIDFGIHRVTIGPLELPAGRLVTIRFIESVFPPGMQTRVHAHPGVEAFYVVEGEQCMETPAERIRILAGQSFVVPGGPHVQTSPKGRRNLAILAIPDGEPWMTLETGWKPSEFCGK